MKYFLMILLTTISFLSFSQEKDSLNLFLNVLDNPDITKVTFYNLDEIGQSSIRTNVSVRRIILFDTLVNYDLYLSNYNNYKDRTTSIGFFGIVKLSNAIEDLKKDLEENIATKNYKIDNFYYLENGFRIGYFFKKEIPQWYFRIDSNSSISELAAIYWFEETIKQALTKIEELINKDKD